VEAEAFGGVAFCAVFFVSNDRATGFGELDANLVATAGFQGQLDE
jgi:hypothetical protein